MDLIGCADPLFVEEPWSATDGLGCSPQEARPAWKGLAVLDLADETGRHLSNSSQQDPVQTDFQSHRHQRQVALQWLYGRHPTTRASCWPEPQIDQQNRINRPQPDKTRKRPRLILCHNEDVMQVELYTLRQQNKAIIQQLMTVLTASRTLIAKNKDMQKAMLSKRHCSGHVPTHNYGDYIQTPAAATTAGLPSGMFAATAEPTDSPQQQQRRQSAGPSAAATDSSKQPDSCAQQPSTASSNPTVQAAGSAIRPASASLSTDSS